MSAVDKHLPAFSFSETAYKSTFLNEIKNNITGESVSFFPGCGAMLCHLQLNQLDSGRTFQILDPFENIDELDKNLEYKGTVLFPFPNRIKDGKYNFQNQNYQLAINDNDFHHALHGFCYNKPFKVIEQRKCQSYAETELLYEEDGLTPGYPFKCSLNLTYTLKAGGTFVCRAVVKNLDEKTIPVGVGIHPYFKLSVNANELELEVPSRMVFEVDNRMIPVDTIENDDFTFQSIIGKNDLKSCYILDGEETIAATRISDTKENVTILFEQETGYRKFNYLQLYVPKDRKSIAIEPQTCAANSLNNKIGLIELLPNTKFEASWSVSLI